MDIQIFAVINLIGSSPVRLKDHGKEKQQIVLGRSGLACGICVVDCVNSLR